MLHDSQLSIVIPARNEGASVGKVVARMRASKPKAEIIVVDDGSTDDTAAVAQVAGALVLRQPYNKGNGAAVKAGIRAARCEYVLLLDADGQHSPDDVDRLLQHLPEYDLVVGARTRASDSAAYRDVGNFMMAKLASYLVEVKIPDLTSGFRVFKRARVMEFIHLLPNRYSYPTTTTMSFIKAGYSVKFVPIVAHRRKGGKSGIKPIRDGIKFGTIMLRMITLFNPIKIFMPLASIFFVLGVVYGLGNYILAPEHRIPIGAALLITTSVTIFLVGLVSEQIAALRFERAGQGATQDWPAFEPPPTSGLDLTPDGQSQDTDALPTITISNGHNTKTSSTIAAPHDQRN